MTIEQILSAIGLIGVGGILKSLFDLYVSNKRKKSENKQDLKEQRYKVIILLSHSLINYDTESLNLD